MILFTLAFLLGDLYLQTFAHLPNLKIIYFLLATSFFIIIFCKKFKYKWILIAFMLGFVWSMWYAHSLLSWSLPSNLEGKPLIIQGNIASIPSVDEFGTHFLFSVAKFQTQTMHHSFLFRLTCPKNKCGVTNKNKFEMKVGDEWQFDVRLKRIHGIQSPGAFDYEAWALTNGLRAEGYILSSKANKWLSSSWYRYLTDQYRQKLQIKIEPHLPSSHTAPWLLALMLGVHDTVSPEDWLILQRTGTNHLMAIAGLHIGMMAAFVYGLVIGIWRFFPRLMLLMPAKEAGAVASFFISVIYCALAGFSIPTKRAFIMLSVFTVTQLIRREINAWYAWSFAMLIVLMINPLTILTESFWLSFATIALIFYGMSGRLGPHGWWWRWGRVQWIIGIGLIPLTLFFFQQCSLMSFIANSIAIPWLSFLILPFCLLSMICIFISPSLTHFVMLIADKNLSGLWFILTWISKQPFSAWHYVIPDKGILFFSIIGVLLLLLPHGMPGRWLGLLWVFPCILLKPIKLNVGDVSLSLLDVGQGLSAVIETQNHLLVFDTGPKYSHSDMGESVLVPFLKYHAAKRIDKLVISHGDNDHLGGAQALFNNFQVDAVYTSVPKKINFPLTYYCLAGTSWQWDNVLFTFLYPTKENLHLNNDSSCVLRIESETKIILLTGDIETFAEKNLLTHFTSLSAHLLIVPHHGSKTSGNAAFISAVNPLYVFYSTGYRNRYHFPHREVVSAYANIHATQFNTAETGTLEFKIEKNNPTFKIEEYRNTHHRYWMDS